MRSRDALLSRLLGYSALDSRDAAQAARLIDLVASTPECAHRDCFPGHLTGSAWVVNKTGDKVLLLLHAKLKCWLQPGGHADGEFDLHNVAVRETREESGLESVVLLRDEIFDVDIHRIPASTREPEHYHYDVRFIVRADDAEPLVISDESHDLRWIPLADIERYTTEWSVLRMRDKWQVARRS
jgi:8-oxo-dGTP pyrophosphatase MutT (NUDIX family)